MEEMIKTVFTMHPELREQLVDELGDVLWYIAMISQELGYLLDDVAYKNIQKLQKRKEENKIKGHGDCR